MGVALSRALADGARTGMNAVGTVSFQERELTRCVTAANDRFSVVIVKCTCDDERLLPTIAAALDMATPAKILDALALVGSVVLIDDVEQTIYLQRDRLGIGRLYWLLDGERLLFSADLRQLRRSGPDRTLCAESICLYLTHQYFPYDTTPFQDVYKVEPGSRVIVQHGRVTRQRYWIPCHGDGLQSAEDFNRAVCPVANRVYGDIAARYRNLGLMCSGGVDSTANAAWLAINGARPIALTATFDNVEYDESPYAAEVSRIFGLPHVFTGVSAAAMSGARDAIARLIEPIGDQAALATHAVLEHCRSRDMRFDAIVSGEGGDELWGMPRRFDQLRLAHGAAPDPVEIAARYVEASACVPAQHLIGLLGRSLGTEAVSRLAADRLAKLYGQLHAADALSLVKFGQLLTWLPENVLTKDISLFESHGSAALFPLIADGLVDAYCAAPAAVQAKISGDKRGLLATYRHLLSDKLSSKSKHRFVLPMEHWMDELLALFAWSYGKTDPALARLFCENGVRELVSRCATEPALFHRPLWAIVVLSIWLMENRGEH